MKIKSPAIFMILLIVTACNREPETVPPPEGLPIDRLATDETKALFLNMKSIASDGILFGHQDDLAYGVYWKEVPGRSDVKDASGSYPAVFGWDVSKLGQRPYNIDSVNFEKMKGWIVQAFQMGGVNTISWHMDNPVTGGDSWDATPAVHTVVPGGSNHTWYIEKLDLFAEFLSDLKSGNVAVPVIFRPFHEHTGDWFWWGRGNSNASDFIALWQFTVKYLKDQKGIHHLLYAYSTDRFSSIEDYLEFYPGDAYVDLLAYDDYHSVVTPEGRPELMRQLRTVVTLAEERGKIAALSETGYEMIPDADWWTDVLLPGLTSDPAARRIAYVLVWRNARLSHHYAPFDGHISAADFKKFRDDPFIWFQDEIPVELYQLPK